MVPIKALGEMAVTAAESLVTRLTGAGAEKSGEILGPGLGIDSGKLGEIYKHLAAKPAGLIRKDEFLDLGMPKPWPPLPAMRDKSLLEPGYRRDPSRQAQGAVREVYPHIGERDSLDLARSLRLTPANPNLHSVQAYPTDIFRHQKTIVAESEKIYLAVSPDQVSQSLLLRARAYLKLGHDDLALADTDRSIEIAQKINLLPSEQLRLRSEIQARAGNLEGYQDDRRKATELAAQEQVELATGLNPMRSRQLVDSLRLIPGETTDLLAIENAQFDVAKASLHLVNSNDPCLRAIHLETRSRGYADLAHPDLALRDINESIRLHEELGLPSWRAYAHRSGLHAQLGDSEAALADSKQAIELQAQASVERVFPGTSSHQAQSLIESLGLLPKVPASEEVSARQETVLAIHKALKSDFDTPLISAPMAFARVNAYRGLGQYDRALQDQGQFIELVAQTNNLRPEDYQLLSELHAQLGDTKSAQSAALKAAKLNIDELEQVHRYKLSAAQKQSLRLEPASEDVISSARHVLQAQREIFMGELPSGSESKGSYISKNAAKLRYALDLERRAQAYSTLGHYDLAHDWINESIQRFQDKELVSDYGRLPWQQIGMRSEFKAKLGDVEGSRADALEATRLHAKQEIAQRLPNITPQKAEQMIDTLRLMPVESDIVTSTERVGNAQRWVVATTKDIQEGKQPERLVELLHYRARAYSSLGHLDLATLDRQSAERLRQGTTRISFPSDSAETGTATGLQITDTMRRSIENLREVAPGFLRSGTPTPEGLKLLRDSGLKTLVALRESSKAVALERKVAEGLGLKFLHIETDNEPLTKQQAAAFLSVVRDPALTPVLWHCKYGRERTGAFTALWRMAVDGWSNERAIDEAITLRKGFRVELGSEPMLAALRQYPNFVTEPLSFRAIDRFLYGERRVLDLPLLRTPRSPWPSI